MMQVVEHRTLLGKIAKRNCCRQAMPGEARPRRQMVRPGPAARGSTSRQATSETVK